MTRSGFRVEGEGERGRAIADMAWEEGDREDSALFDASSVGSMEVGA
jgi:hypothetical protein